MWKHLATLHPFKFNVEIVWRTCWRVPRPSPLHHHIGHVGNTMAHLIIDRLAILFDILLKQTEELLYLH